MLLFRDSETATIDIISWQEFLFGKIKLQNAHFNTLESASQSLRRSASDEKVRENSEQGSSWAAGPQTYRTGARQAHSCRDATGALAKWRASRQRPSMIRRYTRKRRTHAKKRGSQHQQQQQQRERGRRWHYLPADVKRRALVDEKLSDELPVRDDLVLDVDLLILLAYRRQEPAQQKNVNTE